MKALTAHVKNTQVLRQLSQMILGCMFAVHLPAQTTLPSSTPAQSILSAIPPAKSLYAVGLPNEAKGFRSALPGIFDQTGHERRILQGTITQNGASLPFIFTRELDQNVRLDLAGALQRSYIITALNTLSVPQTISVGGVAGNNDADILEVLTEDSPEAFLYSFGSATQLHWLGGNYHVDENNGSLYDIYSSVGNSGSQPGNPSRTKAFLFDSKTKLLAFTRYTRDKGGSPTSVEIAYGNWGLTGGQMVPGSITRSENGQMIFSITFTSAASASIQTDSLFKGQ